jgi:uncharacterized protein (DUF4415 family)
VKARKKKVGKPLKGSQVREVYSVRLPPDLARRAQERGGGLTPAVEQALEQWLRGQA